MKNIKSGFLIAAVVCAFAGCSKPTDAVIPSDSNQWTNVDFINQIKPLGEDDKRLLMGYLMRHKLAETFGGKPMPIGTTVGQAIDEQKKFQVSQANEQAAQDELKKQMEERNAAAAAQLSKTIILAFLGEKFEPSDFQHGQYDDLLVIDIGVKNAGQKAIKGVRGELTLKNTFGDVITTTRLNIEETIQPGQDYHWTGSRKLNKFEDEDKKLMNLEDGKFTAELRPTLVVYEDGTKVGAD